MATKNTASKKNQKAKASPENPTETSAEESAASEQSSGAPEITADQNASSDQASTNASPATETVKKSTPAAAKKTGGLIKKVSKVNMTLHSGTNLEIGKEVEITESEYAALSKDERGPFFEE